MFCDREMLKFVGIQETDLRCRNSLKCKDNSKVAEEMHRLYRLHMWASETWTWLTALNFIQRTLRTTWKPILETETVLTASGNELFVHVTGDDWVGKLSEVLLQYSCDIMNTTLIQTQQDSAGIWRKTSVNQWLETVDCNMHLGMHAHKSKVRLCIYFAGYRIR